MPVTDLPQTFSRFERLAEAFIAQPSVVDGLDLDEAANHLKRVAAGREDAVLTALVHRFLRAIPRQEVATLSALLEEIRDRVAAHDQR
ncbi:MAG: hypothetical protein MUC77_04620 [Chromatiaceae bacterium]|jgi:hypothetical protein|nr:hypothetical protein [Chromatiaceae bacterium]